MLFRTCSKFAAFWYKKQCFGLFWQSVHGCIVLFGVKSIFLKGNALLATSVVVLMLIVSDKNSSKSVFGPFWYKKQCILLFRLNVMDFTQFSPNQQCTGCKNNLLKVQNTLLRHFLWSFEHGNHKTSCKQCLFTRCTITSFSLTLWARDPKN